LPSGNPAVAAYQEAAMSNIDLVRDDPTKPTCAPPSFEAVPKGVERLESSRQWTLKGLAPETVEVSRDAAKRSGMKLNAWVSRALEQAATDFGTLPASEEKSEAVLPDSVMIQHIKEELVRLRAQNEDMRNTVNTMSSVLLKLCAERI
jgi:hypothetical protein